MAETRRTPPQTEVRQGIVAGTVTFVANTIQWLLLALTLAILVEWVGMIWWWPEAGIAHSQRILSKEQGYLGAEFRRHLFSINPARFATMVSNKMSHVVFDVTGMNDVIAWATIPPGPQDPKLRTAIRRLVNELTRYLIAAKQVFQVFGTRLSVMVLAVPVLGLCSVVAIVDGLVRRDLRRWGGGRESGFIYHWVKRIALPLTIGIWLIYLFIPVVVHPSIVIVPFSIALGLGVTATVGNFKKYL